MALAAMHPADDVSRTTSTTTPLPLPPPTSTITTTATSPQSTHQPPRLPSLVHLYQPESALPSLSRTPTPLSASPLRRSLPALPSASHGGTLTTPRVIGDPLLRNIPPPAAYAGSSSSTPAPPPYLPPSGAGPSTRRLSVPLPLRGEKRKSDLIPPAGTNIKDYCAVLTPFIYKLYCLVSDEATNDLCCWSEDGLAFLVRDPTAFAASVLPNYFKHNQFSSFVRQLNKYRFHKLAPGAFLFGHERFVRGRPDLLREIGRQRSPDRAPVQSTLVGGATSSSVTPASPATKRQRIKEEQQTEYESVRTAVAVETAPLRGDVAALRRENVQLNARVQQLEDTVAALRQQHVEMLQSMVQRGTSTAPQPPPAAPVQTSTAFGHGAPTGSISTTLSPTAEHFGYVARRALQRRSLPLPPPGQRSHTRQPPPPPPPPPTE